MPCACNGRTRAHRFKSVDLSAQHLVGVTQDLPWTRKVDEPCSRGDKKPDSLGRTHGLIKVVAWYDNEWAYASKLLDLATAITAR